MRQEEAVYIEVHIATAAELAFLLIFTHCPDNTLLLHKKQSFAQIHSLMWMFVDSCRLMQRGGALLCDWVMSRPDRSFTGPDLTLLDSQLAGMGTAHCFCSSKQGNRTSLKGS